MRLVLLAGLAASAWAAAGTSQAADWRVQRIDTPARVMAVETVDGKVQINAGGLWYRILFADGKFEFTFVDPAAKTPYPQDALPDGRIAVGSRDIARAWLAEPTTRYEHGILGDKIEAGSLVIEARDGKLYTVRLKNDAVFEDLEPRLADLDGDGRDEIVLVKSYLTRGSSLAVIAARNGKYDIVAETPPVGRPNAWLNPAGIADFNDDGKPDIAMVRMPHAVGNLELWTWADKRLRKIGDLADTANHIAGARTLGMNATADFDGDGVPDLALPSFDRSRLRILGFKPSPHEIAGVTLPAKVATNIALLAGGSAQPAIAVGLSDGSLIVIRRD
jgi:hypothetical protein